MSTREIWQSGTKLLVRHEANAYAVRDDGEVTRTPTRLYPGEVVTVVTDYGPSETLVRRDAVTAQHWKPGPFFVSRTDLRVCPPPSYVAAVEVIDLRERVATLEAEVARLRAAVEAR